MSMMDSDAAWKILWTIKGRDELLMIGVCEYPTDTAALDKAFAESWESFLKYYWEEAAKPITLPNEHQRKLAQDAFNDGWLDMKEFEQGVDDMFQRILKHFKPDENDPLPPFYDFGQDE